MIRNVKSAVQRARMHCRPISDLPINARDLPFHVTPNQSGGVGHLLLAAAELDKAGNDPSGRELGIDGDGLVAPVGFGGLFKRAPGCGWGLW